jgi:hypothetical protein
MQPPPSIFSTIRFTLPASTHQAFRCLDQLAQYLSASPAGEHQASSPDLLAAISQQLEEHATQILSQDSTSREEETSQDVMDSIWARTTEVTLQLPHCTMGELAFIDTLQTSTLRAYQADWSGSSSAADLVRGKLQEVFNIVPDTWMREQEILEVDLEDTRDKSRLIAAIRTLYSLDQFPSPDQSCSHEQLLSSQKQNANRFLCRLFPELSGAFAECHIAVSATLFFFVLPDIFCDEEPMDGSHHGFAAFRSRLKKFKQWQFAQFPMFGFLRGDEVDPNLIEELADISGLAPSYIRRELGRVIGFLPLAFVERYLVHDVWGHGWQASMLRLEGLYQQLAAFDQNFDWNSAIALPDHSKLRLSDCLQRTATGHRLHDGRFTQFMERWIWNRIPTAMTPLVAELVADLFEHKLYWTHPQLYSNLQTTSILPDSPAKLDLMLEDLRIYFKQIFKATDLFCQRNSYRQRFAAEMVADGIDPKDAAMIVEKIRQRIEAWRSRELASQRIIMEDRDGVLVNLFGYLEHHIVLLGATSSIVARQLARTPTEFSHMQRWNDWFALLIAVYFEQDPAKHFWKLPSFIHSSMRLMLG